MEFTTIYNPVNRKELILVRNILEFEDIKFKVLEEQGPANVPRLSLQVPKDDYEEARELLQNNGYLVDPNEEEALPKKKKISKAMIIILAFLAVIVAIIFFVWFMIPS
ncbi:hypothetical protein ACW6QP_02505 [Salegentibacter sp. HM20]